jgi:hypothetical protein
MRTPSTELRLATCVSPVTARSGLLVRRSKLSTKNCAIERAGRDVVNSPPPVQGVSSVVAITANAGAAMTASQTARSTR